MGESLCPRDALVAQKLEAHVTVAQARAPVQSGIRKGISAASGMQAQALPVTSC